MTHHCSDVVSIESRVSGLTPTYQVFKDKDGQSQVRLCDIWHFFDRPYGIEARVLPYGMSKRELVHFVPVLVFINFKLKRKHKQSFKSRFPCLDNESSFPLINQVLAFHDKYKSVPWDLPCSELDLDSSVFGIRWVMIQTEDAYLAPQEFYAVYSLSSIKESLTKPADKLPEYSESHLLWHSAVKSDSLFVMPSLTSQCDLPKQSPVLKGFFQEGHKLAVRPYKATKGCTNRDIDLKSFLFDNEPTRILQSLDWEACDPQAESDNDVYFWDKVKELDRMASNKKPSVDSLETLLFMPRSGAEYVKGWFFSENDLETEIAHALSNATSHPSFELFSDYVLDFN